MSIESHEPRKTESARRTIHLSIQGETAEKYLKESGMTTTDAINQGLQLLATAHQFMDEHSGLRVSNPNNPEKKATIFIHMPAPKQGPKENKND
ncbi:MAG TPA: hypothetical protein VE090_00385 [Methylomirabilota bacterium]|nr:hypothetical protein [Methylomirabilota bacterium]